MEYFNLTESTYNLYSSCLYMKAKLCNTCTAWYFPSENSERNMALTLIKHKINYSASFFYGCFQLALLSRQEFQFDKEHMFAKIAIAVLLKEKIFFLLAEKTSVPTIHLSSLSYSYNSRKFQNKSHFISMPFKPTQNMP